MKQGRRPKRVETFEVQRESTIDIVVSALLGACAAGVLILSMGTGWAGGLLSTTVGVVIGLGLCAAGPICVWKLTILRIDLVRCPDSRLIFRRRGGDLVLPLSEVFSLERSSEQCLVRAKRRKVLLPEFQDPERWDGLVRAVIEVNPYIDVHNA